MTLERSVEGVGRDRLAERDPRLIELKGFCGGSGRLGQRSAAGSTSVVLNALEQRLQALELGVHALTFSL
jgi:hypothetical protein